ncbi:MAG: 50S ribosomal protein L37Ae [Candidatus Heimdallarchaeota archaeon LC_3]|nr:MAG: 50S ribosomal protein L37Ae [Candidatus Heimdallarchaeota archaeon LC_3]
MGKTKKMGITGRFGARYGSTLRKRVKAIEEVQKQWHNCPSCKSKRVKRISIGIWECRFCKYKFAGGAFLVNTSTGQIANSTAKRLETKK